MGLFVTGSFSVSPGHNAKVKARSTGSVSMGDILLSGCAFLCPSGLIHGLLIMVPLHKLNYTSGNLPQILCSQLKF